MKVFILLILLLASVVFISGCATTGKVADETSMVGSNVGNIAPDFTVTTTDGKIVKLADFVGEKPLLLYFGATWCSSCWADLGIAKKVYPEFQEKVGFQYVSLDLGEDENIISNYKTKRGYTWDLASGSQKILKDYNAVTTTTKYAINRKGKIIYKGYGVFEEKDWRNLFTALLES
ncbi:MAG TPA: redoxin domain-containing protein [archaeon]|nr:redoxin domain-containing protein [archaeon]